MLTIPFKEATFLLKEGDVLLYRGNTFFSWFIRFASKSSYTHVSIASRNPENINEWQSIQFREFVGHQVLPLIDDVKKYAGRIDVFRPAPFTCKYSLRQKVLGHEVEERWVEYKGYEATKLIREFKEKRYGWRRIWRLSRYNLALLRIFFRPNSNDKATNGSLPPVCSTAVATAIRKVYADLTPWLSDHDTCPGDIARSSLLNYLFTLTI